MKIISVINEKGGTAKTSTALSLGYGLKKLGKKVLLIDADSQAHLTSCFVKHFNELPNVSLYDAVKGTPITNLIHTVDGLDIVPSNINLSRINSEYLKKKHGKANRNLFKSALSGLKGYHYIIIDCPPALSLVTLNALNVSTRALIPLKAEYLNAIGLSEVIETIRAVKRIPFSILLTQHSKRIGHVTEIVRLIKKEYRKAILKTKIRNNIAIPESQSFNQSIYEYAPKSNGAVDYMKLSREILRLR